MALAALGLTDATEHLVYVDAIVAVFQGPTGEGATFALEFGLEFFGGHYIGVRHDEFSVSEKFISHHLNADDDLFHHISYVKNNQVVSS